MSDRLHSAVELPSLLIATGNRHKALEIEAILRGLMPGLEFKIATAADFPQLPEPEETGMTFLENAMIKAHYYARATGHLALADDSGLVVDALEGRPGVRSARYAASPQARIERVMSELKDIRGPRRSARFVCVAALADPSGEIHTREGRIEGWIAPTPRGDGGFGYDPIFIPAAEIPAGPTEASLSAARTLAEYSADEKNRVSHRGEAMRQIAKVIRQSLGHPSSTA